MSFKVERIIFHNRAPFINNLDLSFGGGLNVLTGINGKGKTTILSYIMDSWVELTRRVYGENYRSAENSFYRISTDIYDLQPGMTSYVYIRFKYDEKYIDYVDVRNCKSRGDYDDVLRIDRKILYEEVEDELQRRGVCKRWGRLEVKSIRDIFNKNIVTYFPYYRFETPNFLTSPYKQRKEIEIDRVSLDSLPNNLEVVSDVDDIARWILDVVLDSILYQKDNEYEKIYWDFLNHVLQDTLSVKYEDRNCRFGIGKRHRDDVRLSIVSGSDVPKTLCPTIKSLSAGELSLIAIFGEILRQSDNLILKKPNFSGIVLIDEVDKHLHMKLQRDVLPSLFQIFPNIQFIVTSHSPFLNMGLANSKIASSIIDLDMNGVLVPAEDTQVLNEIYDSFFTERKQLCSQIADLRKKISKVTRPILLTEGKTDIEILKKAMEQLQIGIDIEFIDCGGDSKEERMIEEYRKIHNNQKIIAVFDRDNQRIVNKYKEEINSLGNNVYAFCLPVPQTRSDVGQNDISIEYYFTDEEVRTEVDGKSLFFGNDFSARTGRCILEGKGTLIFTNQNERGKEKIVEANGGCSVLGPDENENILLTKSDFAEAITSGEIAISQDSWDNFRPVFDIISTILNHATDSRN